MRTENIVGILVACLLLVSYQFFHGIDHDYSGTVVLSVPIQEPFPNAKPFEFKGYQISFLARFELKALVLSAHRYYWGAGSKLAPVDLALGWGPMSDGSVLKKIDIHQGNRWYFYYYKKPPIAIDEIVSHSANMHLVASTTAIEKLIKKAKKDDRIELKGYLINIVGKDGWYWNSSQSRTDTGDGSCELIWVEEFRILS